MERGVWWATAHGVTKSRTRLSDREQHRWQAGSTVVLSHRTSGPQQIGVTVSFDPHVPGLHWEHFVHSILGHSAPWVPCTLIANLLQLQMP